MSQLDPLPDPRLAVAIARAERRREMLEQMANMGMALAREISQRFVEGPQRPEGRDPARSFSLVSRAVRLTLMLEARIEKQILAWRKDGALSTEALEPEPFLKPRIDCAQSRRERVGEAVYRAIDRETGDPNEARWMRERVSRQLFESDDLNDYRLQGGFRACVEAICEDLGLEPDWSGWDEDIGFGPPQSPSPGLSTSSSTIGRSPTVCASQRATARSVDEDVDRPGEPHPLRVTLALRGPSR